MYKLTSNEILFDRRPFLYVLVAAVLINIAGIGIDFFTDDPALYSLLARNMARTNNFSDLFYHGRDWLDKPHFPFWVTALSFKLLGVNTIAYKLPALLFVLISVLYTYKLAVKFYGGQTALIAVLILLTAQHTIMSNTDVRAEPYLMGLLTGSVYHFYRLKERFSITDLLLASLFAACAVMTKGVYLLIPIGCAIIGDYIFKKDIKGLFHWKWLLSFTLVCLFILPEVYTLYRQFDLHPEKVVFGRQGISGIRWFFWDSQFGRFNNNGYIRNTHGSIFFFLHTLLWAFAPWVILFFYALVQTITSLFKNRPQPEYLCVSASVVMLLLFSVSKFQLPFYTNILFPFFAVITSVFITSLTRGSSQLKFFKITQYIICSLLLVIYLTISIVFAPKQIAITLLILAAGSFFVYIASKNSTVVYQPLFLLSCVVVIVINTYFAIVFYPVLLTYKGGVVAAKYINNHYPGKAVTATFDDNRFDFYLRQPVFYVSADSLIKNAAINKNLIFTDEEGVSEFKKFPLRFNVVKVFDNYPKENLTPSFINAGKRNTALNHLYLITVK